MPPSMLLLLWWCPCKMETSCSVVTVSSLSLIWEHLWDALRFNVQLVPTHSTQDSQLSQPVNYHPEDWGASSSPLAVSSPQPHPFFQSSKHSGFLYALHHLVSRRGFWKYWTASSHGAQKVFTEWVDIPDHTSLYLPFLKLKINELMYNGTAWVVQSRESSHNTPVVIFPALYVGVMAHTWNPNTQDAETGRLC